VKGVTSSIQTQLNAKGTGTVTSVAQTVPTGLTITGSPVTTTGTLAIALDTGYVIPLQTTIDGKASVALSNLASVAINTTLVSDTDNTDFLGTTAITWAGLFLGNGSVIAWNSAPSTPDLTLTHSANTLTLAGGLLSLGAGLTVVGTTTLDTGLTGVLRADSGVVSTDSDVTDLVSAASDTAAGKVELATITETNTGTDTGRAVTPDGLSSAVKSIMLTAAGGSPLTTAGCSDPTKVEAATNDINYYVLDFDASTEEHAFWSFTMPENWDAGTVNATFYWTNAAGLTTETVVWGIAGGSWGNDDAIDAALGTEVTTTDTWLAQGDLHISPESTAITIANAAAGEWVNIVVARKVASDDLTGDARLIAVKLTYTIDQYSDEI
jgi:hypothetical protein